MSRSDGFDAFANAVKFNQEYNSIWCSSKNDINHDHPIHIMEKDNTKIMLYELIGLNDAHLKVDTEFINKTKTTYLNITGKFKDELTGWENKINIHEKIDTDIYCGYDIKIEDGILTVILYEIVNSRPKFSEFATDYHVRSEYQYAL